MKDQPKIESSAVKPYDALAGKKRQVEQMFDNIAPKYDLLNHLLSANIDKLWRKKTRLQLEDLKPKKILDVASGTADLAIELARLRPQEIIGVDISEKMLEVGRKKVTEKKLQHVIKLQKADSENLPFADNTFDAVAVAFGVRNFENLPQGLSEMYRVTKQGGRLVVLEFSKPAAFPVKQMFYFYFNYVLPVVGKIFSEDKRAYTYLPESVQAFPEGKAFARLLEDAGFKSVKCRELTFGISSLYTGEKS